jgi:hypothetical protein
MKTFLDVIYYSFVGCFCMFFKDWLGTVLIDAISNGKHKLAGNMDGLLDIVSIILSAFSGVHLIALGWPGWVGIIPIGLVGKLTTENATKWSHKNIKEEPEGK